MLTARQVLEAIAVFFAAVSLVGAVSVYTLFKIAVRNENEGKNRHTGGGAAIPSSFTSSTTQPRSDALVSAR